MKKSWFYCSFLWEVCSMHACLKIEEGPQLATGYNNCCIWWSLLYLVVNCVLLLIAVSLSHWLVLISLVYCFNNLLRKNKASFFDQKFLGAFCLQSEIVNPLIIQILHSGRTNRTHGLLVKNWLEWTKLYSDRTTINWRRLLGLLQNLSQPLRLST